MGKLKEKLLNNLTPEQMDEQFDLSAFEYVELLSKYKDKKEDEYVLTDDELANFEQMVQDYYNSKEFREYVENYEPTNEDGWTEEMEKQYWEEQPPYPFATQTELDEINDKLKVKFTEDEVIEAIKLVKNEEWFITRIQTELNGIWNRKNGVF